MSQVIYARVPDKLKAAADSYAADRGLTLTSAVVELLEGGLEAATNAQSVESLQARVAELTAEQAGLRAEARAATSQLSNLSSFARKAQQHIGACPNPSCAKAITGADLLADGQCPHCGTSLSPLIAPPEKDSSLNQREVMILVGALGALVGAAVVAAKTQ